MLKLMKYEFRKLRTALLAMLGTLIALEIVFLVGNEMHKNDMPTGRMMFSAPPRRTPNAAQRYP